MRLSLILSALVVLAALAMPATAMEVGEAIWNLEHGTDDTRAWAALALQYHKDPTTVGPLVVALREDDYGEVRMIAAFALGAIGDTRAIGTLIEALKEDSDPSVRMAAASVLGTDFRDPRAVDPLIETLNDESWDVRSAAATSLGKIGDPRAIEPLTEAMEEENEYVRDAASSALETIEAANESPLPVVVSVAALLAAARIMRSRRLEE